MVAVKNLVGQKFGELTVLQRADSVASGAAWLCSCSCGNNVAVAASNLRKGQERCKDCGLSHARADLTGQRFGRLVVRKFSHSHLTRPVWICDCDCGNETSVISQSLVAGNTQSCGCLGIEKRTEAVKTHGMSKHPLYDAWTNMKQRCQNEAHPHYDRYGARGIVVCDQWASFEAFVEDMQPTWVEGLTLERSDVNGHYEPGNCIWATRQQQSQNKEKTIKVELDGKTFTLPELAEKFSINQHTLWYRWKNGKRGADLIRPAR